MLGGFWMVADVQSEAMGTTSNALLTVGYDTQSKKYVGTWVWKW